MGLEVVVSRRVALFVVLLLSIGPAAAAPLLGDMDGDARIRVRDAALRAARSGEATHAVELDCNRDGRATYDDVAFIVRRALAKPPAFALPLHELDPGLVEVLAPDGTRVEFQGAKTGAGLASVLSQVLVEGPGEAPSQAWLDPTGLPGSIVLPDGTMLEMHWSWPDSVLGRVTTAEGVVAETQQPLTMPGGAPAARVVLAAEPPPAAVVTLSVTACGLPAAGASASLSVTSPSGPSIVVPGQSLGSGTYAFTIPVRPTSAGIVARDACERAAAVLDDACTLLQLAGPAGEAALCPALAAAASLVATPATGAAVLAACFRGLGGLQLACSTIGWSPGPGADSLLASACPDVGTSVAILDRHFQGDVTLVARASATGVGAGATGSVQAPASGPFPALSLALDATCSEQRCADGVDDDRDGLVDCADPECAPSPACVPRETDCGNGLDDDHDGWADCDDDDCAESPSCRETNCADGLDDEGDGHVDCADLDCIDAPGCREDACANGLDDDGDGLVDCADPNCLTLPACTLGEICGNGIDDDHDAAIDCADGECALAPACLQPRVEDCANGLDDDGDGLVDCADGDCAVGPPCVPGEDCDNGIDDDGNDFVDCADIACDMRGPCGEHACDNARDDDHDGLTDCQDPDCACGENCSNGQDDNANGAVDCADMACKNTLECPSFEDCANDLDDDGDLRVDCADTSCESAPPCMQALYCGCYFDSSSPNPNDWWWHCWQSTDPESWPPGYLVSPGECQCGPEIFTICH